MVEVVLDLLEQARVIERLLDRRAQRARRGLRLACSRRTYATLSNTLIGNGFGCWKTIVTRRRSAVGSSCAMSMPSSVIVPPIEAVLVNSVSRLSDRSSVVLPQPEGPISASTSPWRIGNETERTA